MNKRSTKKIIIALVFFFAIAAISWGVISLTKYEPQVKETCYDGKQNQKEEGVDCGGPCAVECNKIDILSVKYIYIKDGFYSTVAEVRNLDQNQGADNIPYVFELLNSAGKVVGKKNGSTFILPNQKKYIVEPRLESSQNVSRARLSFRDSAVSWQRVDEKFQSPFLVIRDKEYRLLVGEPGYSQATGVVINKSNIGFDVVEAKVVLFDTEGEIIGVNSTEINTLIPEQERYFETTWFDNIRGNVTEVSMSAETNIFKESNVIR